MSLDKINPFAIVVEHLGTLRDASDDRPRISLFDGVLHIGLPVVAGVVTFFFNARFTSDGVSLLITALSVFVGLLFNLLVLATSLRIADFANARHRAARRLNKEILVNIEFAICVAFLAIVILLPLTVTCAECTSVGISRLGYSSVATALVAAFVSAFILTLLMVLKRMHASVHEHFAVLADDELRTGGTQADRIIAEKQVAITSMVETENAPVERAQ